MTTTLAPAPSGTKRPLRTVVVAAVAGLALAGCAAFAAAQTGVLDSLFGSDRVISAERGASRAELADSVVGRWGTTPDEAHHYELLADGTGSRAVSLSGEEGDGRISFTWHVTEDGALGLRDLPGLPDEHWQVSVLPAGWLRFEDAARPGWSLTLSRHQSSPAT